MTALTQGSRVQKGLLEAVSQEAKQLHLLKENQ